MLENIVVLDAIRAASVGIGVEVNARLNGVHQVAAEIDLADYNYPRKILVCVSVGTVGAGGLLNIDMEHGDATLGLATDPSLTFTEIDAVGDVVSAYTPTKRFINVEAVVTVAAIELCITLVMEHSRYGSQSGLTR